MQFVLALQCGFQISDIVVGPIFQFTFQRRQDALCKSLLHGEELTIYFEGLAALTAVIPRHTAGDSVRLTGYCTEETRPGCQLLYDAFLLQKKADLQFSLFRAQELANQVVFVGSTEPVVLDVAANGTRLFGAVDASVSCVYYDVLNNAPVRVSRAIASFLRDSDGIYAEAGTLHVVERYFQGEVMFTTCATDTIAAFPVLKRKFQDQSAPRVGSIAVTAGLFAANAALLTATLVLRSRIARKTKQSEVHGSFSSEVCVGSQPLFQDIRGFF